jgi:hypothetical protein
MPGRKRADEVSLVIPCPTGTCCYSAPRIGTGSPIRRFCRSSPCFWQRDSWLALEPTCHPFGAGLWRASARMLSDCVGSRRQSIVVVPYAWTLREHPSRVYLRRAQRFRAVPPFFCTSGTVKRGKWSCPNLRFRSGSGYSGTRLEGTPLRTCVVGHLRAKTIDHSTRNFHLESAPTATTKTGNNITAT